MTLEQLEKQILSLGEALLKPKSLGERLGFKGRRQSAEALLASLDSLLELARQNERSARRTHQDILALRDEISALHGQQRSAPSENGADLPRPAPSTDIPDETFERFYLEFENKCRGTQESITKKLSPYIAHLAKYELSKDSAAILDCGCGRGEWLELLQAAGYQNALGLDSNNPMIAECRSKGLTVVHSDVLAYLQECPPESLQAITAFHVIEHIPFRTLLTLLQAAYAALAPGGLAIFETPNPRNLIVGATTFHFDPTHDKPLPCELLLAAAKFCGFRCLSILQQNPSADLLNVAKTLPPDSDLLKIGLEAGLDYGVVLEKPDPSQPDSGPTKNG